MFDIKSVFLGAVNAGFQVQLSSANMAGMKQRYEWIDLLRGIAVIGMIWVHAANTFLAADEQEQAWFNGLRFYHGLIAPTFFWVAGYMRGLAAAKLGPRKPAWPTVKRLLWVWAIGYLLHVPWDALARGDFSAPVLRILFQSDVLHCLAASCLLLLAVERGIRDSRWRAVVVFVLCFFAVKYADRMAMTTTGLPPLDAYLAKQHGSIFPLFPWFAFAGFGFLIGQGKKLHWGLSLFGAFLAGGIPVLASSSTDMFFFERLGWVMMIAVGISLLTAGLQFRSIALPQWLLLAGRQSLVIYVAHLLMIHAVPWWSGRPLDKLIGPTKPVLLVLVIFLGLVVGSWLVAWAWERRANRARTAQAS